MEDQDKDKNNNNKDKDKNNKPTQIVYKDKNAQYRQYELNKENTRHESVISDINKEYSGSVYHFTDADAVTYSKYNKDEINTERARLNKECQEKEAKYDRLTEDVPYWEHICGDPNEKEHIKEHNDAIDAYVRAFPNPANKTIYKKEY